MNPLVKSVLENYFPSSYFQPMVVKDKGGNPHIIDPEEWEIWLKGLESDKYLQAQNVLETPSEEYCCLGLACKLIIPHEEIYTAGAMHLFGTYPDDQPGAPGWLRHINYDFEKRRVIPLCGSTFQFYSITRLNDEAKVTFPEIAKILRKVYEPQTNSNVNGSSVTGS